MLTLMDARIAFIGGGNMARSLVAGLIAGGLDPGRITVGEPSDTQREALRSGYGVRAVEDNADAVKGADAVVLAVKPQVIADVTRGLAAHIPQDCLVLSIAAGIRTGALRSWLDGHAGVIRAMPNTPALLGCGITALFARPGSSAELRTAAEHIMRSAGKVLWIDDESLMDAVTAVSGSGPAYFFLLMESLAAAAVAQGLPSVTARTLAVETALGAARMAAESDMPPETLRRQVTSPGGTTEAALAVLESGGLSGLIAAAVAAATRRGCELADDAEDGA